MVTIFSQVAAMATIWKKPVQESNYEPTKSAMVLVHRSPAPAPMDMRGLPIQEADYDQAKSLMVIRSLRQLCLPTVHENRLHANQLPHGDVNGTNDPKHVFLAK